MPIEQFDNKMRRDAKMQKIESIEFSRGIAALLVVCFHSTIIINLDKYFGAYPLGGFWRFGHAGVDFFFVLSGFIIYYSSYSYLGKKEAVFVYLQRRLIRIYPIYWAVCLVMLPISIYIFKDQITVWESLLDILLLPREAPPFIAVAWTLRHEMLFYILFCLFFLHIKFAWIIFFTWQVAILGVNVFDIPFGPVGKLLFSAYNHEFFYGLLVAYCFKKGMNFSVVMLYVGVTLFSVAGIAESLFALAEGLKNYHLIYGFASGLIVMGLLGNEKNSDSTIPALGLLLGRASYSIYLVHFTVLSATIKLLILIKGLLPLSIDFFILFTVGVAAGIVFYSLIEQNLLLFSNKLADVLKSRSLTSASTQPG